MTAPTMREWLAAPGEGHAHLALLGAPLSKASISPSEAWSTPPAFRAALARFPTWDAENDTDISSLRCADRGDIEGDRDDADAAAAPPPHHHAVRQAAGAAEVVAVIGGDNSLTRPAFLAMSEARPQHTWGLLTFDAHHDCRPVSNGSRNGTPVRELIEGGLPGDRVAQIGIHPQGNAQAHAQWAAAQGVHVYRMDKVRSLGIRRVLETALQALDGAGVDAVFVDVDVDVLDRAYAPGCPASLPGGMHPHELIEAVQRCGRDSRVQAIDLTEVDARADVNQITVRGAAAIFTAFCSGLVDRQRRTPG